MPSTSEKQARMMQAVAHGWKKPGGGGPSVSVAKEFVAADKARKYAEGGGVEENPWDVVPRSPEGRPQISVTPPPSPGQMISDYARKASGWLNQPSPIKPGTPPQQEFLPAPGQEIGEGVRGLGRGLMESYKEMASPYEKNEQGYVADQPIPQTPGKIPAAQKDPISFGAPIAAEVASTFAGVPGQGALWGLGKAAAAGVAGVAAKVGKVVAREGFLETSHFKSIGLSKGTMPGGFKVDPATGTEWYVKQAPNLEQAKNEKLTAELYKLFGVPVAEVHLTTVGGKPGIASKKIEGSQLGHATSDYAQVPELHENYPIHALLANHDAVGTGPENPLGNIIIDKMGKAHVIDTGGGLLYKGTGSKKAAFTPEVNELTTMADPTYSHLSAEVFGGVDHQAAMAGAQKIANVSGEQIAKLVELYGPSDKMEKLNLLSTLLKRKHNIEREFGVSPGGSTAYTSPKPAEPRPAPKDPYEQIPFTEDDYEKWAKEATPPPAPDDVMKHGRPTQVAAPQISALENLYSLPFAKSLGKYLTRELSDASVGKKTLQEIGKKITAGPYDIDHWNGAVNLWQIAEHINPQAAEAIFRNLPVSEQPKVGYAIKALKNELDYSPFNSVAKGSGKDGKFPLDYDYYTTHTTKFQIPESLLKDKAYQGNVKKYAALIEGKPAEAPQQIAAKEEYSGIPAGYANAWLNAPKEAQKMLEHFKTGPNGMINDYDMKGLGKELANLSAEYPEYADKVYLKLPSHLKSGVLGEYSKAKKELEKIQLAKDTEKAALGNINPIDGRIAAFKKNNPIGIAFAKQFLKPIDDWKSWKPTMGHTKPFFTSVAQKNLAESLGFNTNFEIHKGGEFPNPSWENEAYPSSIPDPSSKPTEPAWFGSDQAGIAQQYGKHTGGTYIVGGKKIFEADWHKYTLEEGWSPQPMHNLIIAARNQGADMVIIHGMHDMGGANQTQYAVINPAILRAPGAKFDKSKLHKSYPLAGLAGGGLFTYGALSEGNDKMNRGGIPALMHRTKALARGGPGSSPWAVRNSSHPRHHAGMIKSSIPGRTDKIPMSVPPGSYILPADVPSALGEGNTMAGEKILGTMFKSGPYSPGSTGQLSGKMKGSRPPRMQRMRKFADGGEVEDIPIIAAGGEYVIHPEQVAEIGNGDMKAGHRVLDKFVLSVRKRHIETLKGLAPPKK